MKNKLKDQKLDEAFKLFYSGIRDIGKISELVGLPSGTITGYFIKAGISIGTLKRQENMYKV